MNIKPDNRSTQPISDDQELAKVLAGVDDTAATDDDAVAAPAPSDSATTPVADGGDIDTATADPIIPELPEVPPVESATAAPGSLSPELENIKQEALGELRPLVDKLDVGPEEKFDTYLLLLRSTDDRDLIAPAHEAAKAITDESRKAQALLDIIKEIDFLGQNQQSA